MGLLKSHLTAPFFFLFRNNLRKQLYIRKLSKCQGKNKFILRKFGRKLSLNFVNNLRKYTSGNFEEIWRKFKKSFKIRFWENFSYILKIIWGIVYLKFLRKTILRKFGARFSLNFGNNLGNKRIENFEEICMYFEILRKF